MLMPKRHFSNWLRAYAEFTAASEAPAEFHFWTGIAVLAGALRRKVWVDQRYFQWTPNFYIVLVAPAGIATKSTSMAAGLSLLRRVESVHMGPQSMTWQALTQALAEACDLIPYGDEYLPMSCVTCDVSELGTFLRPEDHQSIDVLTDLWDGREITWQHVTKTQGATTIQNPWINVIGCTTPTWIRQNIPEQMIGGGFLSRVVFVYADKKHQLVPFPADIIDSDSHTAFADKLVEDLAIIASLIGEYTIDPEAKAWIVDWYAKHWTKTPEHLANERFEGYIARKQTHLMKLSIVLAAAARDELIIKLKDVELANAVLTGAEQTLVRVFEMVGMAPAAKHVSEIVSLVRGYKSIERRALWRLCIRSMTEQEFSNALMAGISAEMLIVTTSPLGPIYSIGKHGLKP